MEAKDNNQLSGAELMQQAMENTAPAPFRITLNGEDPTQGETVAEKKIKELLRGKK